jgi:hypothetical protein
VRLHADRVDDRVGAAAAGELAHRLGHVLDLADVDRLHAVALRAPEPLGYEVEPDDLSRAEVLGDPARHLADRAQADHGDAAALGYQRVLDRLPGGRQHVGQEEKAVVRGAIGDLDGPVVGLRHAQELGLPAGHLAVELRVAEQRGAHALVVVLGRLALRLQSLLAHEAVATGDVERDHHAVADGDVGHRRADGLDDPHRLVAEHVALAEERSEHLVQMQVRAAQPARGDADHGVGGLLDRGIGDVVDAHVALAVPGQGFHRCSLVRVSGCATQATRGGIRRRG